MKRNTQRWQQKEDRKGEEEKALRIKQSLKRRKGSEKNKERILFKQPQKPSTSIGQIEQQRRAMMRWLVVVFGKRNAVKVTNTTRKHLIS